MYVPFWERPETDGISTGLFFENEIQEIIGIEKIIGILDVVDAPVDALLAHCQVSGFITLRSRVQSRSR